MSGRDSSARTARQRRGKPVVALVSILGIWIGLRVVFWQSPFALPLEMDEVASSIPSGLAMPLEIQRNNADAAPAAPRTSGQRRSEQSGDEWMRAPIDPRVDQPIFDRTLPDGSPAMRLPTSWDAGAVGSVSAVGGAQQLGDAAPTPARRIVGHNLLLAAGLSQLPMSPLIEPYLQGRGPVALANPQQAPFPVFVPAAAARFASESEAAGRGNRWSMDAWALWRDDMSSTPVASTQPSYGRSQIGAVLRYSLAESSGHLPQAYLRASAALEGPAEREAALGLSARPLASMPVRIAAEARVSDRPANTQVRAAAYAVSEFPPVKLPAGMTGEAYVQAGYVSGDFDTGFVDGQARVTRDVVSTDDYRLSAGGGAWGGAQRGASRVDVGPSASLTFKLGDESYGRLSADYRIRVAGDAAPASGPAITLSAGF